MGGVSLMSPSKGNEAPLNGLGENYAVTFKVIRSQLN